MLGAELALELQSCESETIIAAVTLDHQCLAVCVLFDMRKQGGFHYFFSR
jgi:hypothetical protein